MARPPVIATLLLLTSAASARVAATGDMQAPQPLVVTTDTDAYCDTLSRQIDRYGQNMPREAASLRAQGMHLCAQGQVRGGINRLRRALAVLREPSRTDDGQEDDADRGQ